MTSADIVPYLTLAGGCATLFAAWWNLRVTGRRRGHDLELAEVRRVEDNARRDKERLAEVERDHEATRALLLGVARVARNRLSIMSQVAGIPIDGYVVFERFFSIAYSASVAALAATRGAAVQYFNELSFFEQAIGSARHSLDEITRLTKGTPRETDVMRANKERVDAFAGAMEAAAALDRIRKLFGDDEQFVDVAFPEHEIPTFVRLQRDQAITRIAAERVANAAKTHS